MDTPRLIWDSRYANYEVSELDTRTDWLDRWVHLFPDKTRNALDVGCGLGLDTETLRKLGFKVTSIDFSAEAIKHSRQRNPDALHLQKDISSGLGNFENQFSLVVANLSLHYFSKNQTTQIFQEIDEVLEEGGLFIFRLNAKGDRNFGAPDQVETWTQVQVNGVAKQFFDKQMIKDLLHGYFEVVSLQELETKRYVKTKRLIECVARKAN